MSAYLLSIGSNAPGAQALMKRASEWLASNFAVVETSGIYASAAINGRSPDYLNMVVRVESPLTAERVIALGKDFEAECGRTSGSKARGCVEMDVDLIQADNVIIRPVEFTRHYFLRGLELIDSHL